MQIWLCKFVSSDPSNGLIIDPPPPPIRFGRKPIQLTWYSLIFICLVLCYCGQGAVLLDPDLAVELKENPFFALAPNAWVRSYLVGLSTGATLIASQSVISGAFAVVEQAISLDMCPRLTVIQLRRGSHGEIYIPALNVFLGFGTIVLVGLFRESSRLASAYGLAVCGAMLVDTSLLIPVLVSVLEWRLFFAIPVFAVYLVVDSLFFLAGASKFFQGAFLPCGISIFVYFVLSTWMRGRNLSAKWSKQRAPMSMVALTQRLQGAHRIPGSVGVFLTRSLDGTSIPYSLELLFKQYGTCLHETIVMLSLRLELHSSAHHGLQCQVRSLGDGFWLADAVWDGVGDQLDLVHGLAQCMKEVSRGNTTIYLHRETPIAYKMSVWRASVYAILLEIGRGTLSKLLSGIAVMEYVKTVHV